jgi:hypothetical protein
MVDGRWWLVDGGWYLRKTQNKIDPFALITNDLQ